MKAYKIEYTDVDTLHFDYTNPRLVEFFTGEKLSDNELLRLLWETMAVDEIVLSIASSGFFDNEPLLIIDETPKNKREKVNIVIEGNRRLAAVKSILNQKALDGLLGTGVISQVPPTIIKELQKIPTILVESRQAAWKYIGFKHINGPAKWGSFAKAQYIAQIHKEFGYSLNDIAKQIGDTNKTVQKLYQGLKIIEQAEELKVFDRGNIMGSRLYFSHLYTALGYENVQNYLNIKDADQEEERPINKEDKNILGDFLTWLYGNRREKIEPVIKSQNPDLRRLDSILASREAIIALKDGVPLTVAFELSQPSDEVFRTSLSAARQNLQKAHSYWTLGYDGEEEPLRMAGSIADLAETLYEAMEKKYQEQKSTSKEKKKRLSD